jgi:hypothetical protein
MAGAPPLRPTQVPRSRTSANNPQQSWGFEGEPPEAVIKEDLRILVEDTAYIPHPVRAKLWRLNV